MSDSLPPRAGLACPGFFYSLPQAAPPLVDCLDPVKEGEYNGRALMLAADSDADRQVIARTIKNHCLKERKFDSAVEWRDVENTFQLLHRRSVRGW